MSSIAAQAASINFADVEWEKKYSSWRAYGQSKLADLLMGLHLARVSQERGWRLLSTIAHPGYTKTNLQSAGAALGSGRTTMMMRIVDPDVLPSMDAVQGAGPELMATTDPAARNGAFYGPKSRTGMTGEAAEVPVYRSAKGPTLAASVWALAAATTGVDLPRA